MPNKSNEDAYPRKLKTTKKSTREHSTKSPNARSEDTFLNSTEVHWSRSEAEQYNNPNSLFSRNAMWCINIEHIPAKTNIPRLQNTPARKELKGNVPTKRT